ncbi:MAG: DUF1549 domain-containing protein, partial [Bacteroidota bacterium]
MKALFRRSRIATLASLLLVTACGPDISEDADVLARLPDQVDYNYHIRPLLSDRCFSCHGPDPNTREAGLRLDVAEAAYASLADDDEPVRFAIQKGDLSDSEVWHRMRSDDPELQMPPPESHLSLTEYEIALISKWIDQGAKYKDHWAYSPPEKSKVPKVKETDWVRNAIDHFILKKLEGLKIGPAPVADKEILLRRLTLDLTGLPPTIEEMNAFLADDSPEAYEKVVDRLLQTDAYAERMALEWMDVARYADSHGLHADGWRNMWPWRDWVIKAFKENMPFDQFAEWQMAGDLMPDATEEQILATAFHRNHPMTAEGGVVDEEWRLEYVFDRTNTTSRAFLGLTMECARCHDHKFDPVSQKEYYQMAAFFNNVKELGMTGDDGNYGPCLPMPDEESRAELSRLDRLIAAESGKMDKTRTEVAELADFAQKVSLPTRVKGALAHYPLDRISRIGDRKVADRQSKARVNGKPELIKGRKGKAFHFDNEYDLLYLEKVGNIEMHEPFSASFWIKADTGNKIMHLIGNSGDKNNFWRGWDFQILDNNRLAFRLIHSLPHNYLEVVSQEGVNATEWIQLGFAYDGTASAQGVSIFVNGKKAKTETLFDRLSKTTKTIQSGSQKPIDQPLRIGKSYRAFTGENGIFEGAFDDVWLFDRVLTEVEVGLLYGEKSESSQIAKDERLDYFLQNLSPEYQQSYDQMRRLLAERRAIQDEVPEVMVMEEMPAQRAMFVLDRGVYDAPLEEVKADVPEWLGGFPEGLPQNRLGLARWLMSPQHPLTARVSVNRYWQMYFGQGLVNTPQDFGSQGALPSHPELLDWLAVDFVESGWDVKALQKRIVMSATYRQSSNHREELQEIDPNNELLARGPAHRLSAEMIRDNVLAASGLLVRKIGGESVKPYQPEGLWIDKGSFSPKLLHYKPDSGQALYRRSMYTFIRRT